MAAGEGRIVATLPRAATTIAYSPDGARLVIGDGTGEMLVVDAESGGVVMRPDPVAGETEIEYSPDGRYFAGAGPGPYAHLWDANSGRLVRRLRGAIGPPQGLAFIEGGNAIRVAGSAGFDRGYVLEPDRLAELARAATTRQLSDEECERYLGSSCDDRP